MNVSELFSFKVLKWTILFFLLINCGTDDDSSSANIGSIPDPMFEQALIDLGYDDILDGQLQVSNVTLSLIHI